MAHYGQASTSSAASAKLFRRKRPLYAAFGEERVTDVILWRNRNVSAAILACATVIWFLFDVVEYPFFSLLCQISVAVMLIIFIWSNAAALLYRSPPRIPNIIMSKAAFEEAALSFHDKLCLFIYVIYDAACGKDLKIFLLSISALWISSVLGSYCSFISLLYIGIVSMFTIPVLYKRYEQDVDYLADRVNSDLKKLYKKFDSKVLKKIPRGACE